MPLVGYPHCIPKNGIGGFVTPCARCRSPDVTLQKRRPRFLAQSLALGAFLAVSCRNANHHAVDAIHGVEILQSPSLRFPQLITTFGRFVIVGDAYDSVVKVFDLPSGRLLADSRSLADGAPGFAEFESMQVHRAPDGTPSLWVFDPHQIALFRLGLDPESLLHGTQSALRLRDVSPLQAEWLNDSVVVGVGALRPGRFSLSTSTGELVRTIGTVPLIEKGMPLSAAQQALQPSMAINQPAGKIAIGARYAGRLDVYSTIDGGLSDANVPVKFDPPMSVLPRANGFYLFVPDENARFGYVSLSSTDSNIYALFSGRNVVRSPSRIALGDEVHIFGWDGALKKVIHLDRDLVGISVDTSGSRIYGLTGGTHPTVVMYELR